MGCDDELKDFNCDCRPHYPTGAYGPVPPFWGYSNFTPTIPKLYWNVDSQEQRILNLFELLDKLICYCNNMGMQIDINAEDIEKLKDELQRLEEGGLLEYYEAQIYAWIQDNMKPIIERAIKFVCFGLTDDGYFCAYIPNEWNQILFDTGAVYGTEEYGHLILKYDACGHGVINNTGYDFKQLVNSITSEIESATGKGLSFDKERGKLDFNAGNGLSVNAQTNMVDVPVDSETIRYSTNGLHVPDADEITKGVTKVDHDITVDGTWAVDAQGVYAWVSSNFQKKE